MKKVAVLGASNDTEKYGHKAVRAYQKQGWEVYPVNPKESEVCSIKSFKDIDELPDDIDRISFYINPKVGITLLAKVKAKGIKEVFINPGAESDDLLDKADELGINLTFACSIRDIGEAPGDF